MCWPSLTEDCVASHATLAQQLEQILQSLREALELPGTGLTAWEQMRLKWGEDAVERERVLWTEDSEVRPTSPLVNQGLSHN